MLINKFLIVLLIILGVWFLLRFIYLACVDFNLIKEDDYIRPSIDWDDVRKNMYYTDDEDEF